MAPITVLSVVWEECVDWKECIRVFGKKYCIEIHACIRIVNESGNFYLEVSAFGQSWRYNLTSACHVFYEVGIARFKICVNPIKDGVSLVLEGCIGVAGIEKCWTILRQDVKWFLVGDLTKEEADQLGIDSALLRTSSGRKVPIYGSLSSELPLDEAIELLKLPTEQ
ncbi:hypothetical protein [Acuticoccus kandeliae]|uniref:hypothetical protein n=1 Tax=Acuticoccus kandeliae TaxID=2073160 RepID=UPI0013005642|nr:hypothetical protein [Acuticoccus kandeliae]